MLFCSLTSLNNIQSEWEYLCKTITKCLGKKKGVKKTGTGYQSCSGDALKKWKRKKNAYGVTGVILHEIWTICVIMKDVIRFKKKLNLPNT